MIFKPLLVFGAGQVAEVFGDYLTRSGIPPDAYVVTGNFFEPNKRINGVPVIAWEDMPQRPAHFVVGMSFRGLNKPRAEKFELMRSMGYSPLTYRHSMVGQSPSAHIGAGSFVMDLNNLQAKVEIGENVIAWSGSHFGHHCKIGSHCFIASHAVISGAVEIGERTFVGVNATIADGVKIGSDCIIGAGAMITEDCAAGGVYPGISTARSRVSSARMRGIWAV